MLKPKPVVEAYDPKKYWIAAGKTYMQDFLKADHAVYRRQEKQLIKYLQTIEPFNSVLEFGAGFGRITDLITNYFHPSKYTAVDISQDQLANIEADNVQRIICDITKYDDDNRYDLVIAVETLMHQLPNKVQRVVNIMKKLSQKHVINLDYYTDNEEIIPYLAPHNFSHDYRRLYNRKDLWIIDIGAGQFIFHLYHAKRPANK